MALVKGSEVVKKLHEMKGGDEVVVNGAVVLRLPGNEWKVSPKGLLGDYDTKAVFLYTSDLAEEFGLENTFQFDEVP
jgi:hypothetical protein